MTICGTDEYMAPEIMLDEVRLLCDRVDLHYFIHPK